MISAPKKGVAIVFVLVLMATMAVIATQNMNRLQHLIKITGSQQQTQQAYWYAISAESLALSALTLSLKKQKNINLSQPWAQGERIFPIPEGYLISELTDMQSCFNLNVFARLKHSTSTSFQPNEIQQFIKLLLTLDVSSYQAEMIAENLWEFIDDDSVVQTRLGREDSEYLGRIIPFYAQNKPFLDLSEFRVIHGMDALTYKKIRPHVCVQPDLMQQVNVNTLKKNQALLLEALFTPHLTLRQAQQLLNSRPLHGWLSIEEFMNEAELSHLNSDTKQILSKYVGVSSNYFNLRTSVKMDDIDFLMNTVIKRRSEDKFEVIWHQKGELE